MLPALPALRLDQLQHYSLNWTASNNGGSVAGHYQIKPLYGSSDLLCRTFLLPEAGHYAILDGFHSDVISFLWFFSLRKGNVVALLGGFSAAGRFSVFTLMAFYTGFHKTYSIKLTHD